MADDLKSILYGKTETVALADGKVYTLREPSIDMLESMDISLDGALDVKQVKRLAYAMLKEDNEIDEKTLGRLITISVLPALTKAINKLCGTEEKNV